MKGFVYILRCADGSYYTGSTKNLEYRLYQHQNGEGANHTKTRLPVELVYFEEFERIDEAFYREKQVQGWSRKKKEALIARDFDKLSHLSRSKGTEKSTKVAEPVEATKHGRCPEPVEATKRGRCPEPVEGAEYEKFNKLQKIESDFDKQVKALEKQHTKQIGAGGDDE